MLKPISLFCLGSVLFNLSIGEKGNTSTLPITYSLRKSIRTNIDKKVSPYLTPLADDRTLRYTFGNIHFGLYAIIYNSNTNSSKGHNIPSTQKINAVLPSNTMFNSSLYTKRNINTISSNNTSPPSIPIFINDIIENITIIEETKSTEVEETHKIELSEFSKTRTVMPIATITMNGQNFTGDYTLASGDAEIIMTTSTITGEFTAEGVKSRIELSNSSIAGNFSANNNTTMSLTNSTIGGTLNFATANNSITLTNSNTGDIIIDRKSTNSITITGSNTKNISIGEGTTDVNAGISSTVSISNSTITGNLKLTGESTTTLNNTSVTGLIDMAPWIPDILTVTNTTANRLVSTGSDTIILKNSTIGSMNTGTLATETIFLTLEDTTFNSTVTLNNAHATGNTNFTATNSRLGNIFTTKGKNTITLSNSTIANTFTMDNTGHTLKFDDSTLASMISKGGSNTISGANSTVASMNIQGGNNIFSGTELIVNGNTSVGSGTVTLRDNSSIGGTLTFTGASIFTLTNSTITGGSTFSNGNDSITISNSSIGAFNAGGGTDTITLSSVRTGRIDFAGNTDFSISNNSTVNGDLRLDNASRGSKVTTISNTTITGQTHLASTNISDSSLQMLVSSGDVKLRITNTSLSSYLTGTNAAGEVVDSILNNTTVTGNLLLNNAGLTAGMNKIIVNNGSQIQGNVTSFSLWDFHMQNSTVTGTIHSNTTNDTIVLENVQIANLTDTGGNNSISITQATAGVINIGGTNNTVSGTRLTSTGALTVAGTNTTTLNNSTIGGALTFTGATVLTINSGSIAGGMTFTNNADSITLRNISLGAFNIAGGNDTINLETATVAGNFSATGSANITLTNTNVTGTFSTGGNSTTRITNSTIAGVSTFTNGNDSIAIINTTLESLQTGLGNDTVRISNSRITNTSTMSLRYSNNTDLSITNSSLMGDIRPVDVGGNATIHIQDSTVNGQFHSSSGTSNYTINIIRSSFHTFVSNLNDTVSIVDSTITNSIRFGVSDATSTINGTISNSTMPSLNLGVSGNLAGRINMVVTNGSQINGSISALAVVNLAVENINVTGELSSSNKNDTLSISNSSIVNLTDAGGNNTITATSSRLGNITIQGTGNNTLSLTSTTANNLTLGSGNNTITGNSLTLTTGGITATGTTNTTLTNSAINGNLQLSGTNNTLEMTNTSAQSISLGAGANSVTLSKANITGLTIAGTSTTKLDDVSVDGSIQFDTNTNLTATNLNITDTMRFLTNTQHTISLINANIPTIEPQGGPGTTTILHLTATNIITNEIRSGSSNNTIALYGNNSFTGPFYNLGTGTTSEFTLHGTLNLTRNSGATDFNTEIQGRSLILEDTSSIKLLKHSATNTLKLTFNSMQFDATKPTFELYVDTRSGVVTKLDIASITNVTGGGTMLIDILPNIVTTTGTLPERITDIILSNANITPQLNNNGYILSGHNYSLEKSLNAGTPNNYDLVRGIVSETNQGYTATQISTLSYNASLAQTLSSHFLEELHLTRDREGKKIIQSPDVYFSIFSPYKGVLDDKKGLGSSGFSTWIRGGYSNYSQTAQDAPKTTANTMYATLGVDLAAIPLGNNVSAVGQFFGSYGMISNNFSDITEINTEFSTSQTAITLGGTAGLEFLLQEERGKLYANASIWYSMMNNTLSSNRLQQDNTWNSSAVNFLLSTGYSIYVSQFIITPQVELYYSNILAQNYLSNDGNLVEFESTSSLLAKGNIIIAYTPIFGFVPFFRGGVEMPLIEPSNLQNIQFSGSSLDSTYTYSGFTASATAGLSYRYTHRTYSITFTGEFTKTFGAKDGIEASAQMSFAFK